MDALSRAETEAENDVLQKKLQYFILHFVLIAECKFTKYNDQLKYGLRKSKLANNISELINAGKDVCGEKIPFGPSVFKVIDKISTIIDFKIKRDSIKKLLKHLYLFEEDPSKVRVELIRAGIAIFKCFEYQFMLSTCENGTWQKALSKIAEDLVDKILNYLKNNTDVEFTCESITKGALNGESRIYANKSFNITHSYRGHTLINDWNTSKMFKKTGLVIVKSDGTPEMYFKNSNSNCVKYGFRCPFEWETKDDTYETTEPPAVEYRYSMVTFDMTRTQSDLLNYIKSQQKNSPEENLEAHMRDWLEEIKAEIQDFLKELEEFVANNPEEIKKEFNKLSDQIDQTAKNNSEMLSTIHKDVVAIKENTCPKTKKHKNPVWFEVQEPVNNYVTRQGKFDAIEKGLDDYFVVIAGLSGMGKSEMAKKYAHDHIADYIGIIWIDSSSQDTITNSFQKLAKDFLKIKLKYDDGVEKQTEVIVKEVYNYFSDMKSLFIFDSADYDRLERFLPRNLYPENVKPHVLITTQARSEWNTERGTDYQVILLNKFTDDEAGQLVKNVLAIDDSNTVQMLAKKLYNLPLGLQLAVKYIKERNEKITFTIKHYLEKLDKIDKSVREQTESIYKPLKIALVQLENEKSRELHEILSYFHSENIPADLIKNGFFDGKESELLKITDDLNKYCLARLENNFISAHSLVQELQRKILSKDLKKEIKILKRCLGLLKNKIKHNVNSYRAFIPHVQAFWLQAHKHNELIAMFIVDAIVKTKPHLSYFHLIAGSSPFDVVKAIVEKIETRNNDQFKKILEADDGQGGTPLHYAASNDLEVLQLFIAKGAKVNVRTKHSFTPLHLAVNKGNQENVELLLRNQALVEEKTEYEYTALHFAARMGFAGITQALLNHGANVNARDRYMFSPLHFAVKENHIEVVGLLLAHTGVDVDAVTKHKLTPLIYAAKNGNLECAEALLQKGANVNASDSGAFTSLHSAVCNGHVDVVRALLAHRDIEVDPRTSQGNAPLYLAAEKGHFEIVKALIAGGANVGLQNLEGKRACDVATEKEHVDIMNYLTKC